MGSFNGRRSKAPAAAACLSDSSVSDDDDDAGAASSSFTISRPPTTFQERVASAKLAAASKRSTPAAASRLSRTTAQRQDSLATLDPDSLTSLLGAKTKLCNLVPAGLDTRTSSDSYSDDEDLAKTPTKHRVRIKRRAEKTAASTSSDSEDEQLTTDKDKSKRKLKVEKNDDNRKREHASSKVKDVARTQREKEGRLGHRKSKKEETGQKTRSQRAAADPATLPVFNLGEYRTTAAALSPRLDAIKKSVEQAHKIKRQAERMSEKQAAATRGGAADERRRDGGDGRRQRGDDEIGTRKTLQTGALVKGQTQFVKLKVHVVDASIGGFFRAHRAHCHRVQCSQHSARHSHRSCLL